MGAQVTWAVSAIKRRAFFYEITEEGVFGNHFAEEGVFGNHFADEGVFRKSTLFAGRRRSYSVLVGPAEASGLQSSQQRGRICLPIS